MKLWLIFPIWLFCFSGKDPGIKRELLIGKHWAGGCRTFACDTLEFTAYKKYDVARYQWGGCGEGMEFYENDSAQIFSNVRCSDESNPVDFYSSTWQLKGDTLIMDKHFMIVKYRVISVQKKKLKLLSLGFEMKKQEE